MREGREGVLGGKHPVGAGQRPETFDWERARADSRILGLA